MGTGDQLYGPSKDEGEYDTEDSSATFRISMGDLEAGQEMHVWKLGSYQHDPADVVSVMDEWQLALPEGDNVATLQKGDAMQA